MKTQARHAKIRSYVIARDGQECCYCSKQLAYEEITMEHIVPESKRGTFNTTNLTVACHYCNNARGNKDFFKYAKKFGWSKQKIDKYRKLYFNNLKIKILNLSKEVFLKEQTDLPITLVKRSCGLLKIKSMNFSQYYNIFNFEQPATNSVIKYNFEQLIKIIEMESI